MKLRRNGCKIKFSVLVFVNIIFIIFAYGSPVEIKGALSWLPWLAALAVMIYCIRSGRKFLKALFVFQLIIYVMASGLFCIREYGGRVLYSSHYENNIYTAVYQLNPGAMGHFSVQRREYFCIINGDLLSIRVLLSQETRRGSLEI